MKAVLFNVKTWLIIGVLAIGVAILVAGEPNQATHDDKQTARQGNVNDTPHWYSAFKRPEWLSLIATFIGIGVICWQSWETKRAAEATEISAKAAQDNIALLISKERARLRVDLEHLDLSLQDGGVYEVRFKVSIFGTTPAFITDTRCVAYDIPLQLIDEEDLFEGVMFPLHSLPAVVPPGSEPIQEFAIFHFESDGRSDEIMAKLGKVR
jgi:hypothetical protein